MTPNRGYKMLAFPSSFFTTLAKRTKMSPATGLRLSAAILSLALLSRCISLQETDGMLEAQIFSPLRGCPILGRSFSISCKGYSAFPESIMYWLANDSFVSTLYPSGAVRETETTETAGSSGLFLTRTLSFHPFAERELHTKFECIILDPESVIRKTITWMPRRAQMKRKPKGSGDTDGSGVQPAP